MTPQEILELVPRDALLDELARRFETVVFGGYRTNGDGTGDHMLWYSGHPFVAEGLAHALGIDIHTQTQETRRVDPNETSPENM